MTQHDEFKALSHDTMDLLLNVGLMTTVSDGWPPRVQEAWCERISHMRSFVNSQISEAQTFAEAYD